MRIRLLFFALVFMVLEGCKKQDIPTPVNEPHPAMVYKNLDNAEVKYGQSKSVDVDGDGRKDFVFYAQLVGDPVLQQDRLQFYAFSTLGRQLLNDVDDQSPMLNRLDPITKNYPGYTWYEVSAIVLTEKIITINENHWVGLWKNASHRYLPIQLKNSGGIYHGWVELSFDTSAGKLILHKSAISSQADKTVKAGF